jgi:UDP:flavonoid glycosyltransferase YjiC (YdhE family)
MPADVCDLLVAGARAAGLRLLLGPATVQPQAQLDSPDVLHWPAHVPHSWLLPRVALAVHHAGAGTCAAALHAGCPQLLAPMNYDQGFWAARMVALGVAPVAELKLLQTAACPRPALCAASLAAALAAALAPQLRARAAELAAALRREADGAEYAAAFVAQYVTGL